MSRARNRRNPVRDICYGCGNIFFSSVHNSICKYFFENNILSAGGMSFRRRDKQPCGTGFHRRELRQEAHYGRRYN